MEDGISAISKIYENSVTGVSCNGIKKKKLAGCKLLRELCILLWDGDQLGTVLVVLGSWTTRTVPNWSEFNLDDEFAIVVFGFDGAVHAGGEGFDYGEAEAAGVASCVFYGEESVEEFLDLDIGK